MFGALVPLQPLAWTASGLVCAPRLAADVDAARAALARCPLPVREGSAPPAFPDSPAAMVAGWYRRTDRHAPAPPGVRELVQVAGGGFGPGGHATTAMCLAACDRLPAAHAVDVGCGSGLLAQAWARLHRMPVLAIDLDPAAVAHTRACLDAAGLGGRVEVARRPAGDLDAAALAGAVVLANVGLEVHRTLAGRIGDPPAAVVASGIRPADADAVTAAYRGAGLRRTRAMRTGRFDCHVLEAA